MITTVYYLNNEFSTIELDEDFDYDDNDQIQALVKSLNEEIDDDENCLVERIILCDDEVVYDINSTFSFVE